MHNISIEVFRRQKLAQPGNRHPGLPASDDYPALSGLPDECMVRVPPQRWEGFCRNQIPIDGHFSQDGAQDGVQEGAEQEGAGAGTSADKGPQKTAQNGPQAGRVDFLVLRFRDAHCELIEPLSLIVDDNGYLYRPDLRLNPLPGSGRLIDARALFLNRYLMHAHRWTPNRWLIEQALTQAGQLHSDQADG